MPFNTTKALSGGHAISLKERQEKALQMRIDGYSLRQIADVVGIDSSNLGRFFKAYKSEEIKALQEELFEMQTERLMELWRNAAADVRKFVPVCDAKGNPLIVPVLDENGMQQYDQDNEPMTEVMRDFGVHLNAVNVAARITEKIAAHFGLDAPNKTLMLSEGQGTEVVFRIVDSNGNGQILEHPAPAAPMPVTVPDGLGADSVITSIVNGVEVVSMHFSIPEPPLKYMG